MAETVKVNPEQRMLIDGKLVEADSGKTFENVNPATEEVIGEVTDASTAEMHRAIDAARRAFDETDWSTNHAFRKQCLEQLHEALQAEQRGAARGAHPRGGLPAHDDQRPAARRADLRGLRLAGQGRSTSSSGRRCCPTPPASQGTVDSRRIWREPVGVVGAIVPWNFPFEVTSHKLGQALATGNTVVLKPAPDTPWNATLLGRIVAEKTDIPAGVLNVVTSSDHLIGEELTLSPKVDMISFTGSTAVGQRIMEKGAATMKRVFLELGGKSATIVLDDADFGTATLMGMGACFHAGQGCAIQTRMLLPRARYEEGVELLKGLFSGRALRRPAAARRHDGPAHLGQAARAGARLHREGQGRGRHAGRRGRPPLGRRVRQGLVGGADALHRRRQLHDHRPGGDLRPGALSSSPSRTRTTPCASPTTRKYGLQGGVFSGSLERSLAGGPAHPHRWHRASTAARPTARTCPSAATSTAASGARTGWPASSSTSRPSRWRGRRPDAEGGMRT